MNTSPPQTIYYRVTAVAKRYSVSPDTVWRWTRNGVFPKPVKLSPSCTRWRLSDIEAFEAQSAAGV